MLARSWQRVRLGDILAIKHGFAFDSKYFTNEVNDNILLTPRNFHKDQKLYFGESTKFYTGYIPDGYVLDNGDLLVVMTDLVKDMPILGNAVILNHPKHVLHNQRIGKVIILDSSQIEKEFLRYLLNSKLVKDHIKVTATGGTVRHTSPTRILEVVVELPSLCEQNLITNVLSVWDSAIDKTEILVEAKEKCLKYLVNKIINDKSHPKTFVRDITTELSVRNNGEQCERILSVTNTNGFILPEDQFERRVASEDLSSYKLIHRGQYAYNPSRINVGSIARLNDWAEGVLSPMYVVFGLDEGKINSDFFHYWLSSYEAKERIKRSAQGSVRETVGFQSFGDIAIPLPPLDTQLKIAELLNTARKEIDLLKKQLEALRRQKRGLMQKLLTGEWRVETATEEY